MRGVLALIAVLGVFPVLPAEQPAELARRAFDAVNRERTRRGLARLEWNGEIAALARSHSERMRDLNFFAHDDPERGSVGARIRRTAIPWRTVAENIFVEKGFADPARQAVKGWMGSAVHRRSILGRGYTRTGVGVATDGRGRYWFTQIFVGGGKP